MRYVVSKLVVVKLNGIKELGILNEVKQSVKIIPRKNVTFETIIEIVEKGQKATPKTPKKAKKEKVKS